VRGGQTRVARPAAFFLLRRQAVSAASVVAGPRVPARGFFLLGVAGALVRVARGAATWRATMASGLYSGWGKYRSCDS
jgi:hypothetical protein